MAALVIFATIGVCTIMFLTCIGIAAVVKAMDGGS